MHKISNKIVHWLLQGLTLKGFDLPSVYKTHSINLENLPTNESQLTSDQFATLMRTVYELANDESGGYTDKPLRLGTFRMMCHATVNCSNLRQALLRMMQYFRLISDELDWSLDESGEEAKLTFQHHSQSPPVNGYFVACMLTIIWRWSAWMVDYPLLLNRVYLAFSSEDFQNELQGIFKTTVYCQKNKNQLVIPSKYLNLPVKQNSQSLILFLQNTPECLLSNYQPDNSYSAQIKNILEDTESLESVTLSSLAEQFNCSTQTLARKLKNEGHQFQELKDKVRKNKAIDLLLKSELPISDISSQLGFSEDSVFYRTFKKWTGSTPSQYRQQQIGK